MRRAAVFAWKYVVPALVLAAVGYYFYDRLNDPTIWAKRLFPEVRWLLPAVLMYLGAYAIWGGYFHILLRDQGAHVSAPTGLRAYFISQMGKYVPGKIMVIVIRVGMLGKSGISRTAVGITVMYESLVWVGSGALVGILLLPPSLWEGLRAKLREHGGDLPDLNRYWLILPVALAPIGLVGLNRFVNRVNRWRKGADAPQLPRVKLHMVLFGLAFDAAGWFVLAACMMCLLVGLDPNAGLLSADVYWNLVSVNAIAYVVGFVIGFHLPAGVGVRDFALSVLLAVELGARQVADAEVVALILTIFFRLLGVLVELATAAVLYWFAPSAARAAVRREAAAEAAHV